MKTSFLKSAISISIFVLSSAASHSIYAAEGFSAGPVFQEYGENIAIEGGLNQPEKQQFKVVFDVYKENQSNEPHRGFNSIARFINMHVRAGVPLKNIEIALVVHGKASYDLMTEKSFSKRFGKENPSSDLLSKLLENDVKVFICGQSSSHLGLEPDQFTEGTKVSLSAMTANALLQQNGYTLNPF